MNYPGIQLDWVSIDPSSIIQGITKPLDAQKVLPDIVYIDANQVGAAAASGGLASLNNYLSGSLPFPLGAVKNASWNGGIYAVPLHIDPVVLFYRKDVLSRIGFDPSQNLVSRSIRTWDELLSICQTIKQKVGFFCFDLNKASNDGFLYEAMLQGENLGYQGAVGLPAVDQPSNVQILEQINQFWKNGVVGDEPTWSQEWYGHISSKDQPVAFVIGPASLSSDLKTWIDPGSSNRWGMMTMPSMTGGISAGANLDGGYLGIVKGSKNEEAAWTFMNFLTQDIHSQIALYQSSGWLPAYLPAYNAQELNQPDSYYSGQVPLEIIRQSAYRLSSTPLFTPDYARIHALMQTAIQNTALGILPPEVALKDVASKLSP
jgi:ABC-type glycerol-3-phosphate transport system substrate-binding protein